MTDREDTIEVFKKACEILEDQGHESSVREDYSGRGMYGNSEPAIVTDAEGPMVGAAVLMAALRFMGTTGDEINDRSVFEDAVSFIPGRQDSMGRYDRVYY